MDSKRVVLITGSSSGFGRMIGETLARRGHTVFATMRGLEGRNAAKAAEIQVLAERESLALYVLELDVTDDASVDRAVQAVVQRAGRLDVAINNAGYGLAGLVEASRRLLVCGGLAGGYVGGCSSGMRDGLQNDRQRQLPTWARGGKTLRATCPELP